MKPLSAKEVAVRTKLPLRSVHRYAANGTLPTVAKMSGAKGAFVFDADEIDEWLADRKKVAAS